MEKEKRKNNWKQMLTLGELIYPHSFKHHFYDANDS